MSLLLHTKGQVYGKQVHSPGPSAKEGHSFSWVLEAPEASTPCPSADKDTKPGSLKRALSHAAWNRVPWTGSV